LSGHEELKSRRPQPKRIALTVGGSQNPLSEKCFTGMSALGRWQFEPTLVERSAQQTDCIRVK
jgi:hypothetical protein